MFGTKMHLAAGEDRSLRRRLVGTAAVVALGIASLSGCAAGMISQTADQVPNHDGAFGTVGTVSVANATFGDQSDKAGPVAFAKGSAVPLTLWVSNTSTDADTITSISSSAGDVTLTGDAVVPAQGQLEVGAGGIKAQIDASTADIKYGFPVSVDIYFANAGKLTLNVPVAQPAQRAEGRDGTDIYPTEQENLWQDSSEGH